jgi:hypothetical protein
MIPEYQIDNFIRGDALAGVDVLPCRAILSGSRAYGLDSPDSDWDYLGLHLMQTRDILEHPDFRKNLQVVRMRYDEDLKEVPNGVKGGMVSLDSFEMWKFITIFIKGSTAAYELLHIQPVHTNHHLEPIFEAMRAGVTTRMGRAAKGNCLHDWRKHKLDRKKTVMAYYRLIQAIAFLREGKYAWQYRELFDYIKPKGMTAAGEDVIAQYMSEGRETQLTKTMVEYVGLELDALVNEVDKAMIVTKLPDRIPSNLFEEILDLVKQIRLQIK